jgi:Uncharacterized protein conserved in bacteria (DUF2252)
MQAVSDIFLGWQPAPLPGRGSAGYFYLRQLRDWKYSADTEDMNAAAMTGYGRMCGWTLCGPGSPRATRAPRHQRVSTSRATQPRDGAPAGNRVAYEELHVHLDLHVDLLATLGHR